MRAEQHAGGDAGQMALHARHVAGGNAAIEHQCRGVYGGQCLHQTIAIRLALPPAAVTLIEVDTSSTSQSRR